MSQAPLNNIRLVLVRTFQAGNIGAAARSAKTMGLRPLRLVQPKDYPSSEAIKMAAGAADLLAQSTVHESVNAAVTGCNLVIATTARIRGYDLPSLDPKGAAQALLEQAHSGPVALVFGPERMGLHNKDIASAHYRLTIPANPAYASLNLAAAVQIMSYEIYQHYLAELTEPAESLPSTTPPSQLPPPEQFERLLNELEETLKDVKFLRPHQGETLERIRYFLRRAEPTQIEMNIMLGAIKAIKRSVL